MDYKKFVKYIVAISIINLILLGFIVLIWEYLV
jgi:hypothetical protein